MMQEEYDDYLERCHELDMEELESYEEDEPTWAETCWNDFGYNI